MESTPQTSNVASGDRFLVEGVHLDLSNLPDGLKCTGTERIVARDGAQLTAVSFSREPRLPRERLADPSDGDWLKHLRRQATTSTNKGYCYFVGAPEVGRIKIGYARNVKDRLSHMQVNSPVALVLLAVVRGGCDREAYYHFLYRDRLVRGEWFERCPEIEAEITRLTAVTQHQSGDRHGR